MIVEAKIAPKNSLLLLMDQDSGEIPESMDGKLIASTPSCIAIGTLSEADGETAVTLTDENINLPSATSLHKVFSGPLQTPKKELQINTVLFQTIAKLPVSSTCSSIEIWADSRLEPSKLWILVSA